MTDRAFTVPADQMSGADFWKLIHPDRYARREWELALAAELQAAHEAGDTKAAADVLLRMNGIERPIDEEGLTEVEHGVDPKTGRPRVAA